MCGGQESAYPTLIIALLARAIGANLKCNKKEPVVLYAAGSIFFDFRQIQLMLLLVVAYRRMTSSVVFGILIIAVGIVRLNHIETGYAKPYYHIDARNTYQDINQPFNPYHTEGNKVYKVKSENTYGKPV